MLVKFGQFFRAMRLRRCRSRNHKLILLTLLILFLYCATKLLMLVLNNTAAARPSVRDLHRNGSYFGKGSDWKRVAIGCAITSVGITELTSTNFRTKFPFFTQFLPSFCRTASPGYIYPMYLAFDQADPVFNNLEWAQLFHETFIKMTAVLKCNGAFKTSLHLVQCAHERRPTWAQNDAMIEAYIDGATFFYRVNDDTNFETSQWTEKFVKALSEFEPPYVGVVGPTHTGGNTAILTYDFVHRNHIDMFGFYYPRTFTGWFADNWITDVYKGSGRMRKLATVRLQHDCCNKRYPRHSEKSKMLHAEVQKATAVLSRFIGFLDKRNHRPPRSTAKVISLCASASSPDAIFGALQNARLAFVLFPEWTVRIYVSNFTEASERAPLFSERIINCLRNLNVEITYVHRNASILPQPTVCHLVAGTKADYFLVRDATARLTERDVEVVREWIESGKAIHTIRDHFSHKHLSIVNTLWGGMPHKLSQILSKPFDDLLIDYFARQKRTILKPFNILLQGAQLGHKSIKWEDSTLIEILLSPYLNKHSLCHDSLRCHDALDRCRRFPVNREDQEHLGQSFQAMEVPIFKESEHSNDILPPNCIATHP